MIAVEPSWQDVLDRRARLRGRRSRRRAAGLVVAAALLAAAPALGVDGWLRDLLPGKPVPASRLTEQDVVALVEAGNAPLLADRAEALRRFGLRDVTLVGTRKDVAFYVIRTRRGDCFATGIAGAKPLFATVRCVPAGAELVDVSLQGSAHVVRLAAFAFGRVASVGIPGGARVPTTGHLVLVPHAPTTARLVGYDADGDVVARSPVRGRCAVRLYLDVDRSTADLARAIAGARGTPGAGGVRYVSKAAALRVMRKRYPRLTKNLTINPLPDSIDVTPQRAAAVAELARRLTAAHLPGVAQIANGCAR
jgi:hypothetical protein